MMRTICPALVVLTLLFSLGCSSPEPLDTVTVSVGQETDFMYEIDRGAAIIENASPGYFLTNPVLVADEKHWSIFSHPPNAVTFEDIYVGENAVLDFSIAMMEGAWTQPGDGVRFEMSIAGEGEEPKVLYSRYIDPKANEDERRWIPETIALDDYANTNQTFVLRTFSGRADDPQPNGHSDWAIWGHPRLIHDGTDVTRERSPRPNILFVTIDTLRADYVGAYGHPWVETPTMDALAERGVLFENAHTAINYTNPSHFSMLSSLHPFTHEIAHNVYRIQEPIPSLPMVLKEEGYRTGAIVSVWHLDNIIAGMSASLDHVVMPSEVHKVRPDIFTANAAIDYLEQDDEQPFFLWVHLFFPHTPYTPVSPYHKKYYEGDPYDPTNTSLANAAFPPSWIPSIQTLPEHWLYGLTDFDYTIKQYGAEISGSDAQLGRILDALERLDLVDDTLVIVTADHGEALSDHNIWYDHWTLYEHDIHVPMIMSLPGVLPEGKRIAQDMSTLDIAPTITDFIGAAEHPGTVFFEGRSVEPLWAGEALPPRFGSADSSFANHTAAWDETYKVIWELRDGGFNDQHYIYRDRVFVFDRANDPTETNPLATFTWNDDGSISAFVLPESPPEISSFSGVEYYEIKQEKAGKVVPSVGALQAFMEQQGSAISDEAYEQIVALMAFMIERIRADGIWEKIDTNPDLAAWLQLYSDIPQDMDPAMLDHLRKLGYLN